MELTEPQRETLLHSCEGWFSAIYLNLHALAERGTLLPTSSDIYAMFTAAMRYLYCFGYLSDSS